MLVLITRHNKVFLEKIYLSTIEHDVTTSKIPFLSICLGGVSLDIFLKTFFMYARPIPVPAKVHFKKLQFLAMTLDMEVSICAFDVI